MGLSLKKVTGGLLGSKIFKWGEQVIKAAAKDPLKAAMYVGASAVTGNPAVAVAGLESMRQENKANIKLEKDKKIEKAQEAQYNQQVANAQEKAYQEKRQQLLSLRRQYTKRTTPIVSMGGAGGTSDDESSGGITLG